MVRLSTSEFGEVTVGESSVHGKARGKWAPPVERRGPRTGQGLNLRAGQRLPQLSKLQERWGQDHHQTRYRRYVKWLCRRIGDDIGMYDGHMPFLAQRRLEKSAAAWHPTRKAHCGH